MLSFAANLSLLFTEYPLIERFAQARKAGFDRVEIQFPYSLPLEQVELELNRHELELVLINIPAGVLAAGELGLACLPGREQEFAAGLEMAIEWCQALNVPRINCLAGKTPPDASPEQVQATLAHNLRLADCRCGEAGLKLMIEAINTDDIPGFHLHNSQQVLSLINELSLENSFLQYDVYHMQKMEGNLISTLQRNRDKIGHIQIADVPGRHEPGTGEIHFANLFKALEAMGYADIVSLEYNPLGRTDAGLEWLKPWMTQDRQHEHECSG
ncbi:hydroxypyruvate isomerase family protein [Roseibium sp.]|uniref:hydroxypyruvate isomerase family protein n=1 Tax=Roseibium sp. TaxID=1936156 RepID=UPI003A987F01